jgi:hypothetical protein
MAEYEYRTMVKKILTGEMYIFEENPVPVPPFSTIK